MWRPFVVVASILLAACVGNDLVPCGDRLCPAGQVCASGGRCALPQQVSACGGLLDGSNCMYPSVSDGECQDGLCAPRACGDGVVTSDEVCDDANDVAGDGCSRDCQSDESCGNGIVDPLAAEECDSGIVGLARDGCTSRCTSEIDLWMDISPGLPAVRSELAMAFDSDRQRLVVFGGQSSNSPRADTLELDGAVWRLLHPLQSPLARSGHAMAYDPQRRRVVLFGGVNGGKLDDTWEWDGQVWTRRLPAASPPARSGHAMAYDPQRGEVVLFGGGKTVSAALADTWAWDGTTWAQRAPSTVPPASLTPSLAYDPVGARLVLFTGSQTWTWSGTDWTQVVGSGPSTRSGSAIETTSAGVILFAGKQSSTSQQDTWRLASGTWTKLTPTTLPAARNGHAMAYDAARDRTLVFGGKNDSNSAFGDTWEWSGATWTQINPAPTPSQDAAGAFDARTGTMVVFGGVSPVSNVTSQWDGIAWTPATPATSPVWRFSHAVVATRDRLLMFGGVSFALNPFVLDETWSWDGSDWTRLAPASSPPARYSHAMSYDAQRDRVVLFGGTAAGSGGGLFDDTWEWDGASWSTVTTANAPAPRSNAHMAYDPVRGRTVLFGGVSELGLLADTWEFDGTDWTQLVPETSPAPSRGSAAFDPLRGRVVITTADVTGTATDTWEWDGVTWTLLTPVVVPPLRSGLLVFDSVRGELVMFGNGVWVHRWLDPAAPADRCTDTDTDGDGLVGCADPDCWGRCTPWCPPRTSCDPTLPSCGDGTCAPVEDPRLCPGDCPDP